MDRSETGRAVYRTPGLLNKRASRASEMHKISANRRGSLAVACTPLRQAARGAEASAVASLNPLMALGSTPRRALRQRLSALLSADNPERSKIEALAPRLLHTAADCTMHLPAAIGSYTDFFAGIHHARNG